MSHNKFLNELKAAALDSSLLDSRTRFNTAAAAAAVFREWFRIFLILRAALTNLSIRLSQLARIVNAR